jgi:hypothetical protein
MKQKLGDMFCPGNFVSGVLHEAVCVCAQVGGGGTLAG